MFDLLFLPKSNSLSTILGFAFVYKAIVIPVLLLLILCHMIALLKNFRKEKRVRLIWVYVIYMMALIVSALLGGCIQMTNFYFFWWFLFSTALFLYALRPVAKLQKYRTAFCIRIPVFILSFVDLAWMIFSLLFCNLVYSGNYDRYMSSRIILEANMHDCHVLFLVFNILLITITSKRINRYYETIVMPDDKQ